MPVCELTEQTLFAPAKMCLVNRLTGSPVNPFTSISKSEPMYVVSSLVPPPSSFVRRTRPPSPSYLKCGFYDAGYTDWIWTFQHPFATSPMMQDLIYPGFFQRAQRAEFIAYLTIVSSFCIRCSWSVVTVSSLCSILSCPAFN